MKIAISATALLLLCCVPQQSNSFTLPIQNSRGVTQRPGSPASSLQATLDPTFVQPDMSTIEEVACQAAAARMKRVLVPVSEDVSPSGQVGISYVHWPSNPQGGSASSSLPLIMIHGFDSSALEYRRLGSLLAARGIDTYAVDLLGWGYTQLQDVTSFSAAAKVEALESFATTMFRGKPFCVAGASLGGAAVIELASRNAELCQGLILIDAQGFVDGIGPMASMPTPLASLGVQVLKSVPLRSSANQMSYFDKASFATNDAVRIGRLHCLQDGWSEALVSFMQSGGFSPSAKVKTIQAPALVLWGRQDGILDGNEFAQKFVEELPNAELRWIEECGHVPHLEQPDQTADAIQEFLSIVAPARGGVGLPQGLAIAAAGATAVVVGVSNFM
ncbi:Serine aminopeptidase [Fragilaria crotonensis]|nr:Serine aminopeptidase [Fragilaria crotonensis]